MHKYFAGGAIILMLAACGGSSEERKDGFSDVSKTPEDSLFQEVMDGHDVAMAKMGKLSGYRKEVDQKIDSLKKVKSSAKEELNKSYVEISGRLKDAEEHMNKWMQEFVIDSAQDNMEQRLKYLEGEKAKVNTVKEEILEALGRADSVLGRKNVKSER